MPPEICPNCGAEVPPSARACPECGACEDTGWSEAARYDALDLPDEAFEDDPPARREPAKPHRETVRRWVLPVVAVLLVLAVLGWLF
jgi:hypothetical protein